MNRLLCRICDHAHWHVSEQVRADIASYMPIRHDMTRKKDWPCERAGSAGYPEAQARLVRGAAGS
jgi:hypothetical protein